MSSGVFSRGIYLFIRRCLHSNCLFNVYMISYVSNSLVIICLVIKRFCITSCCLRHRLRGLYRAKKYLHPGYELSVSTILKFKIQTSYPQTFGLISAGLYYLHYTHHSVTQPPGYFN